MSVEQTGRSRSAHSREPPTPGAHTNRNHRELKVQAEESIPTLRGAGTPITPRRRGTRVPVFEFMLPRLTFCHDSHSAHGSFPARRFSISARLHATTSACPMENVDLPTRASIYRATGAHGLFAQRRDNRQIRCPVANLNPR